MNSIMRADFYPGYISRDVHVRKTSCKRLLIDMGMEEYAGAEYFPVRSDYLPFICIVIPSFVTVGDGDIKMIEIITGLSYINAYYISLSGKKT